MLLNCHVQVAQQLVQTVPSARLRSGAYPLQGSLVLAVDNTAAIDVANNLGVTGRTKHFRSSIHYIRDEVMLQRLTIHHVRTDFQLADLFTKALDKTTFLALRKSFVSDPGIC